MITFSCSEVHAKIIMLAIVLSYRGSIAPEIIDNGEITFKSDIYGLGSIIIKLLIGCNKYDSENVRRMYIFYLYSYFLATSYHYPYYMNYMSLFKRK
jgi:serine/threonine protein kinase